MLSVVGVIEGGHFIKGLFSNYRKDNKGKEQEQPLADASSGE